MQTPYLNWTIPDVLGTPGADYAQEINNVFLAIDTFLGSAFTPSQLNINADLDFQSNNAINLRSVRLLYSQALTGPADVGVLYNLSGNLYYNDAAQNHIQITQNGSLNTGINGNIGGMNGTSASVSFNSIANAYSFNASPSRLANINAMTGTFGNVYVSGALYAVQASITSASYGNIQTVTGSLVQATTVSGSTGNFNTLNAGTVNATIIPTVNATQLTSSGGQINGQLTATTVVANAVYANGASVLGQTSTQGLVSSTTAASIFSGNLTTTQNLVANGSLSVNGSTFANAVNASNVTATGNASVGGTLGVTGTSTLATVNASTVNASNTASVTNTFTVGSSKVVMNPASSNVLSCSGDIVANGGFRRSIGPATYYTTSAVTANQPQTVQMAVGPTSTNLQWHWVAPAAGSVTGVETAWINPNNVTYTVIVYKNFVQLFTFSVTNPSQLVGVVGSYAKDTYSFAQGDLIEYQVQANSSVAFGCFIWLEVEC